MANLQANGLDIHYDEFGDPSGRPLLLVMGLGAQMILWDEDFCELLGERGHRVIRFDNRDVGLSQKLDHLGVPNVLDLMQRALSGEAVEAPYLLDDMADDAVGLLDALEIEAAHVMGASMGGMIVQAMALRHRARIKSLVSIMSTTGRPDLPPAAPEAMARLMTPAPPDREGAVAHTVESARIMSGSGYPFDEERIRRRSERGYDRCFHPQGIVRQIAAIIGSGSRVDGLRELDAPALVIHGDDDPLVRLEGGIDTHECIAGSELFVIEGMGHDMPPAVWPRVADRIEKLTERHD